jgi:outer membrane lipoprotein-sorting protein
MRTLALAILAMFASLHAAEMPFKAPPEYSCKVVMTGSDAEKSGKGTMYQGTDGKRRMDMETERGQATVIIRPDTKQMHMLMVEMKMFMTMPLNDKQVQVKDPTMDPNATWKKTGSEKINGVDCDCYEYTSKGESGTAWIDAKQGVPMRVKDGKGKGQMDFSDYQIGPQKADTFEVPKDYKPMGMMPMQH